MQRARTERLSIDGRTVDWVIVRNRISMLPSRSAKVVQSAIVRIQADAEQSARTNTADLIDFLYKNPDDYPLWRDSSANPANDSTATTMPFADGFGGVWV